MKSIRIYILAELASRMCSLTQGGLSKIILGQRSAHFSTAKELADILRTTTDIWQDKELKAARLAAIERLARRKKMGYFVGRGRPRKENI